jgi:hypothetical protein
MTSRQAVPRFFTLPTVRVNSEVERGFSARENPCARSFSNDAGETRASAIEHRARVDVARGMRGAKKRRKGNTLS